MRVTSTDSISQPPLKRFRLLAEDTIVKSSQDTASSRTVDCELDGYLDAAKRYCGSTGLIFWVENQSTYPQLAPFAQDYLSAPASQAYVERVFSVCGDLTSGKRNRLTKNLEKRTFLKMNIRYY
jgi:hypothetical protein